MPLTYIYRDYQANWLDNVPRTIRAHFARYNYGLPDKSHYIIMRVRAYALSVRFAKICVACAPPAVIQYSTQWHN